MVSQTSRKAFAVLFVAAVLALSCAAPSQASLFHPRRASEEPARTAIGEGFAARLLRLFAFIGGALDPNGSH